ncbi:MAG: hypothetical protein GC137_01665 [Alphaproteobacteria bacterium]|nr:hypothetical protein [Alphaproteobacteria bacterium]
MPENLKNIREEIDAIDDAMHDLLMRRASLVDKIRETKKKDGMPTVQPAREAQVMQRLLARHKGSFPALAVFAMWRELFSASALQQADLSVGVSKDVEEKHLVRNYFGCDMPIHLDMDAEILANNLLQDKHNFIVVSDILKYKFWAQFMMNHKDIFMVGAFPYLAADHKTCFVLSKNEFKPSSQDCTIVLTLSESGEYGLETFDGFLTTESAEIKNLEKDYTIRILGGYPVMPDKQ